VEWYREAADAGNVAAMVSLGALLRKRGQEDQAMQWYRKAADTGDADAMVNLGPCSPGRARRTRWCSDTRRRRRRTS
jgi:TPR repeat protein